MGPPLQKINYLYDRNLRPLRKSHVGQPPSAVHPSCSRRRGRLRYILMRKDSDRDFRRGLKLVLNVLPKEGDPPGRPYENLYYF